MSRARRNRGRAQAAAVSRPVRTSGFRFGSGFARWVAWWVLLLAGPGVFWAGARPWVKARLQAMSVLRQVSGEPVPWIVGEWGSYAMTSEDVSVPTAQGPVRGRLYLPVGRAEAPGMVVLHGVHYLGIDEPRLEAFAAALASCGVQVLTPELPDIKDYRVSRESVEVIGESTRWFAERIGHPVGVMGLSFSGGLALLAASEAQYQRSFRFVMTVGAHDDMRHVARFYLTGEERRPDGTMERLRPHEYGALVLEYEHLEDFVPAADVAAVRQVLRAHLYEDEAGETRTMAELTPQQAAEAKQLMDTTSPKTDALLKASDAKHGAEMAALSPAGHVGGLKTPVYLLHGAGDTIIPSAEALWLKKELPAGSVKAMLISPVLSHLDMERGPGLWDQWKLVDFLGQVLQAEARQERGR